MSGWMVGTSLTVSGRKEDKDEFPIELGISGRTESDKSQPQGKCALCGKQIEIVTHGSSSTSTGGKRASSPIIESVEGTNYEFDSWDCAVMFKRLQSVYGERLSGLLGLEQFISDPFWNRVTPDEGEMIQMQNESQRNASAQDIVRIIEEPDKIIQVAFEMIRSAKKEVLIMFSTANAFKRQISIGGPELLREVTSSKKDLVIRILTPADLDVEISSLVLGTKMDNVKVRNMEATLQTKVTVVVVDRRLSLAVELKDDSQDDINEALRSAVYSNTKSAAISYVAIFESLWKQVELNRSSKCTLYAAKGSANRPKGIYQHSCARTSSPYPANLRPCRSPKIKARGADGKTERVTICHYTKCKEAEGIDRKHFGHYKN